MSVIEASYKAFLLPWLFAKSEQDPEIAHEYTLKRLQALQKGKLQNLLAKQLLVYTHPALETTLWGLVFPNPFGLAGGFDKNGRVLGVIPFFGWGFETLGAVLLHPQTGNPRIRMWRSLELQALCNWMGFNSEGADVAEDNLRSIQPSIPIFLNVGKNKEASPEQAIADYCQVVYQLWSWVQAVEINPSSPNTPGLRDYQNAKILEELLSRVTALNSDLAARYGQSSKPIGVKISPDESDEALQDIVEVAIKVGIDFITLTNTTVSRDNLNDWDIPPDRGGVSGRPLSDRAFRVLCRVHEELKKRGARNRIKLISAGGIYDGHELYKRICYGADLCEALTGWVFEGPDFPKRSLKTLVQRLRADGFSHVSEAVGADHLT